MFLTEPTEEKILIVAIVLLLCALVLGIVAIVSELAEHLCSWMYDHQEIFILAAIALVFLAVFLGAVVLLL